MTQVTINLYSFSELNKAAKGKVISDHWTFLTERPVQIENEAGELEDSYEYYEESDVIDSIEANEYVYFQDGELAHCTTYTGKHPKSGTTEFHFHGKTYDITQQPA